MLKIIWGGKTGGNITNQYFKDTKKIIFLDYHYIHPTPQPFQNHDLVKVQAPSKAASNSFNCPAADKEAFGRVEPQRFLENNGIFHTLRGVGSPTEVALTIDLLFSLQKVKKICEIIPIPSVCGPGRYSQAALPDIFGRAGSGGKLLCSSSRICSAVEIATAGAL